MRLDAFMDAQIRRIKAVAVRVPAERTPRYVVPDPWALWHGTESGFRHHGCRCDDCRGAYAQRMAVRRQQRQAQRARLLAERARRRHVAA
ncbi:MAG TPA: hypothetical protein VD994_03220 [Prosthecobacter sp.]|nr:hypothetical protein [Prosthecobacter sp.]